MSIKPANVCSSLFVVAFFLSAQIASASTFLPNQWVPYISGNLYYANQQWYVENGNQPWSFSSTDNNTLHFELRAGDNWSGDTVAMYHQRTEIDGGPNPIPMGTPITMSYQFELEPGPYITSNYFVMGQWHQSTGGDISGGSPPFSVNLVSNGNAKTQGMAITSVYENPPGTAVTRNLYNDMNSIVRGHWYNMSIQVLFSDDSTGYVYVWRDGTQIAAYSGPVGYLGTTDYWKEGIYRAPSTETEDADYRNLVISTSTTPVAASTTAPTVTVFVVPSVASRGSTYVAGWNSLNATSCTTNFTGHTDPSYEKQVTAVSSNTFYVTCTGPYGTASSSAAVTVVNPPSSLPSFFNLFGSLNLFGILQLQ